jgi:hypothetical protein
MKLRASGVRNGANRAEGKCHIPISGTYRDLSQKSVLSAYNFRMMMGQIYLFQYSIVR